MVDPHNIPLTGYLVLGTFWYLVSVWLMFVFFKRLFTAAMRKYTEAVHAGYVKALDEIRQEYERTSLNQEGL